MARHVVESLVGVGEVYAGDVEGHIDITGIAEAVVLAGPQKLRLRVEDGRHLPLGVA